MLSPQDIHKKALRRYPDYLKAVIAQAEESFFPLDIPGNKGHARQPLAELYPALQALLSQSQSTTGKGYTVETHTRSTRHAGEMTLPKRIFFAAESDYLDFLGKTREVHQFREALQSTRNQAPELLPWLANKPQKLLSHLKVWTDILKVFTYFRAHPFPGEYLRALPILVHTKFIEQHKGLLNEAMSAALPATHIREDDRHFETRFGLRYDEPLIRMRTLSSGIWPDLPAGLTDLSLPLSQAKLLRVKAERVFIMENKQTFLAFPDMPDALAIWGKGFAIELLKHLPWLKDTEIWFWGDLDAQGFQMLHQLRSSFSKAYSLLMDEATYEAFLPFATSVAAPSAMDLHRLTPAEQSLYQRLLASPQANRLEQEHISHSHVLGVLREMLDTHRS